MEMVTIMMMMMMMSSARLNLKWNPVPMCHVGTHTIHLELFRLDKIKEDEDDSLDLTNRFVIASSCGQMGQRPAGVTFARERSKHRGEDEGWAHAFALRCQVRFCSRS